MEGKRKVVDCPYKFVGVSTIMCVIFNSFCN